MAGLPASGKTTAAEIGEAVTGGERISIGRMIRAMAEKDGLENPTSDQLGAYAADVRRSEGPAFATRRLVEMLRHGVLEPDYPVFVDSIRHREEVEVARNFFDDVEVLLLHAPFSTRYERLVDRARDGEDAFTRTDLAERDERELEQLGFDTITDDVIDHKILNGSDRMEALRDTLQEIID